MQVLLHKHSPVPAQHSRSHLSLPMTPDRRLGLQFRGDERFELDVACGNDDMNRYSNLSYLHGLIVAVKTPLLLSSQEVQVFC